MFKFIHVKFIRANNLSALKYSIAVGREKFPLSGIILEKITTLKTSWPMLIIVMCKYGNKSAFLCSEVGSCI